MLTDDLLERLYAEYPAADAFADAAAATVPQDAAGTAAAEARRWHALRTAAVTAAFEPYRLGKGKVGGGRFAKKGDVGIDILRGLLRGKGSARTEIHSEFSKRLRKDDDWGRGDLTPSNITSWATKAFGPRPSGQDGNAWDAGRRELSSYLAAIPERSRLPKSKPDTNPGDGNGPAPALAPLGKGSRVVHTDGRIGRVVDHGPERSSVEFRDSMSYEDNKDLKVVPDRGAPGAPDEDPNDLGRVRGSAKDDGAAGVLTRLNDRMSESLDADEASYEAGQAALREGQAKRDAAAAAAADDGAPADPFADGPKFDAVPNFPEQLRSEVESGNGTRENPFLTSDVNAAAALLASDQHVRLSSADEVATLLDKLAADVQAMKAQGVKAPTYDLCKVTVPGTSLFCAESKGIPRIEMPQLSGVPIPGSKADALPKDSGGGVNLGPAFIDHLKTLGINVSAKTVQASHLKASQNELNGAKIVGMMDSIEAGNMGPAAIFTSRDNYVVDGHHRWAANVGVGLTEGTEMDMDVNEVDADIIDVLALANAFALDMGIPQASADDMGKGGHIPNIQPLDAPGQGNDLAQAPALSPAIRAEVEQGTHPRTILARPDLADGDRAALSNMLPDPAAGAPAAAQANQSAVEARIGTPPAPAAPAAPAGDGMVDWGAPKTPTYGLSTNPNSGVRVRMSDDDFAALSLEGNSSAAEHIVGRDPDGSPIFTPERQALHDEIVRQLTEGVQPSDNPIFYMLGGGPAAGKSTMLKDDRVQVPGEGDVVAIDSDAIKGMLPEYTQRVADNDPGAASFAHEESSYLAKRVMATAFEENLPTLLDGTGDSSATSVQKKIEAARAAGYRVSGMYATVPTQVALDRADARAAETGRVVPHSVIEGTHASVSRIFPDLAEMFDDIMLFENSDGPKLIAEAHGPGTLEIREQGEYDAFLAKATPGAPNVPEGTATDAEATIDGSVDLPDPGQTNDLRRPPTADEAAAKAAWDAGKPDMAADDAKYRRDLDAQAEAAGIDGAGMSNSELASALTKAKAAPAEGDDAESGGAKSIVNRLLGRSLRTADEGLQGQRTVPALTWMPSREARALGKVDEKITKTLEDDPDWGRALAVATPQDAQALLSDIYGGKYDDLDDTTRLRLGRRAIEVAQAVMTGDERIGDNPTPEYAEKLWRSRGITVEDRDKLLPSLAPDAIIRLSRGSDMEMRLRDATPEEIAAADADIAAKWLDGDSAKKLTPEQVAGLQAYVDADMPGAAADTPREQMTATDLLDGDTSPENIEKILKSGDLTDAQREELRRLLPDSRSEAVTAALSVAEAAAARRRQEAVTAALQVAERVAGRVH